MLASHEPPLPVAGVAVGVTRGSAEDPEGAGFLVPPHDAVVGNVAAQKIAPVTEPNRAFGPTKPGGETLDGRVERRLDRVEARVEGADRPVRIALRRLPPRRRHERGRNTERRGRAR